GLLIAFKIFQSRISLELLYFPTKKTAVANFRPLIAQAPRSIEHIELAPNPNDALLSFDYRLINN
ncbi:hypothetical protein, partial [Methylotuvimicrobium buryatense]|uniref:hypothetical protein n=1 Tax=Methylotuvimicrobium buryatense TaxID=95641 RepID=UPI001AD8ABCA